MNNINKHACVSFIHKAGGGGGGGQAFISVLKSGILALKMLKYNCKIFYNIRESNSKENSTIFIYLFISLP